MQKIFLECLEEFYLSSRQATKEKIYGHTLIPWVVVIHGCSVELFIQWKIAVIFINCL